MIPSELKCDCLRAKKTMTNRQIYDTIFVSRVNNPCSYESFKRAISKWKDCEKLADLSSLKAGTYEGFTPHGATVQVDAQGQIRQAWIKQSADSVDWGAIHDIVTRDIKPYIPEKADHPGLEMLELPIFDMHFGIASFKDYQSQLDDILLIIEAKNYDRIMVLFGQDMLHNNDMRGHTAKGTDIEKVDFTKAWSDAWMWWYTILVACEKHSNDVVVSYSKGNHDECSSWALFKALAVAFPNIHFDDTIRPRKCIAWKDCFIGFGHCEYSSNNEKIFRDFVLDFPEEFASAKVREIHTGHLHRESMDNGIMMRRLSSAVPPSDWSANNGYIGAHRRFQLFEWQPGRLKAIYYV